VVRRLAPLLALAAGAAYFLLVGELPAIEGDAGRYVAGCAGAVAVGLCALAPLAGRDEPVGVAIFGVGALLLAIALAGRDVGAAANPVEALFAASVGMLFGFAFGVPAAVIALPLVVAGIDAASVFAGGDEELARGGEPADVLTFDLPLWGGGGSVARLGLLDATFLALFAAWSVRYALRPRLALPLMVLALGAAVAVGVALDRAVPALPLVALAFLAPGIGRFAPMLRSQE
jgi:hypothetical protein